MSVLAVVTIRATPGDGERMLKTMAQAIQLTKDNPQCSRAELFRSTEDADRFVFLEEWTSIAAHEAHFENLAASGAVTECQALWAEAPASVHYREI